MHRLLITCVICTESASSLSLRILHMMTSRHADCLVLARRFCASTEGVYAAVEKRNWPRKSINRATRSTFHKIDCKERSQATFLPCGSFIRGCAGNRCLSPD
ncbi:hypothetical protein BO86DRAFT_233409 [Aspergillus japonicus CBS 114.51]|uniref:Uncharacterized protein n=1 Tax=Aspergillus japonicus CBS 114.51 TaxID=1448312 RepID=A0A8T8WMP0_ASPJA|nr:hypothetical protein BO86DRAFT_233409 [Aspergillus japonicus CBS 114.51]RAH77071.1 hypothetical protein BO86DRAFT_233409 [Aspergillus japonicus CBS 114.51]